jgi:hypothetical protein
MGVDSAAVWSVEPQPPPSSTDRAENDRLCRNLDGQWRGVCRHQLAQSQRCMHAHFLELLQPTRRRKTSSSKSSVDKQCSSTTQIDMLGDSSKNRTAADPMSCATAIFTGNACLPA